MGFENNSSHLQEKQGRITNKYKNFFYYRAYAAFACKETIII
jgi:hypothetical protein